jgi:hypothetical protein
MKVLLRILLNNQRMNNKHALVFFVFGWAVCWPWFIPTVPVISVAVRDLSETKFVHRSPELNDYLGKILWQRWTKILWQRWTKPLEAK